MHAARCFRSLLAALLVVGAAQAAGGANLTRLEAEARAAAVRDVDYTLTFDLHRSEDSYGGEAVVTFQLVRLPERLFLDFQGEVVSGLVVNGAAVDPVRAFRKHRIWLPADRLRLGANTVTVTYTNDYDNDGAGLHKAVDPADDRSYLWTQFEPFDANRLFPCFDQPDLKASYGVTASAPADWVVVSNGRELSRVRDGDRTVHRFERTHRFSTYIVALCAGPYAVFTDPRSPYPSRVMTTQSMAPYADQDELFDLTRKGFRFFEKYFGLRYPFRKYDQVFVPQFNWGAMENVGLVIWNDRALFRHEPSRPERLGRANTLMHEMAHMWFGDIVTMKWWNDLWLNESFATYMAHLALAEGTQFTEAWGSFDRGMKGWAYWQDQLPTTHPIETPVEDTDTTFTNFDGITYGKGASTLKQLAFYVGADAFREGVASYLKEFQWGNARRQDFLAHLGRAAGEDLSAWAKLWLEASGVNTLEVDMQVEGGRIRSFALVQKPGNGDAKLRPHQLQVALYERKPSGALSRYKVVKVRVTGERTSVRALAGARAPDFVDANYGNYAHAKVFLDPTSLAFAKDHLELLPDAATRGRVWTTLWFMVRDAATSGRDLLELVQAKLGLEEDPDLVGGVLRNVRQLLARGVPPAHRAEAVAALHALARRRLEATPGSDLQKTWFETYAQTARSSSELARLEALLDGKAKVPGFSIDQPKRWTLLLELARARRPGVGARLDREARQDPGIRGRAALARARASMADAAGKAELWRRFTEDEDTPLDQLRAAMRGFWPRTPDPALKKYVAMYFEALPRLGGHRGNYYVDTFAERLFPGTYVEQATVDAALAAVRDQPSLSTAVRRSLRESADEVRRALEMRARY